MGEFSSMLSKDLLFTFFFFIINVRPEKDFSKNPLFVIEVYYTRYQRRVAFFGRRTFISNFSRETVEWNRVTVKTPRRDLMADIIEGVIAPYSSRYVYIYIFPQNLQGDWTSIGGLYRIPGKIKGERDGKVAGRFLAGEGQRPRCSPARKSKLL